VDMGVAGDLGDLVRAGSIVSKSVGPGTGNIARGPAMSRQAAVRALEAGIEVARDLAPATDLFGTGDMGIGNTTPSAAIAAAMMGMPAEKVTGRGTGIEDAQLAHKTAVVARALEANGLNAADRSVRAASAEGVPAFPLDVLAKVGGFEIGGIAGLILGAAARRKPVLVDGFISTAGALIACGLAPACAEYVISSHRSKERGHSAMLGFLGKEPLIDLDLRLGEGTGAALAMHFVEASVRILTEVATFQEASVSTAEGNA
jgi:nicotinate-nucleotide--dimethylbenzimidazole phosphoribosyltransferase